MTKRGTLHWLLVLGGGYLWAVGCASDGGDLFDNAPPSSVTTTATGSAGGATGTGGASSTSSAGTTASSAGGASTTGSSAGGATMGTCGMTDCDVDWDCCTTQGDPYCVPSGCSSCCPGGTGATSSSSTASGFPSTSTGFPSTTSGFPVGVGGFFPVGSSGSSGGAGGSMTGGPCGTQTCSSSQLCCNSMTVPAYCYPDSCPFCCVP